MTQTTEPQVNWSQDKMIEVRLNAPDDFLKVRETLTRIGVASRKEKKLYQSCHILHKQGKYYIVHFKELFALDGLPSKMTEDDIARRNTIIGLVAEWGLCEIISTEKCEEPLASLRKIKILSHKNKDEWELIPKYHIGRKPPKEE